MKLARQQEFVVTDLAREDGSAAWRSLCQLFISAYVIMAFAVVKALPSKFNYPVILLGLACLLVAPRDPLRRMPVNGFLVLLLVWTTASYSWSYYPPLTKTVLRSEIPFSVAAVGLASVLPLALFVRALLRGMYFGLGITALAIATRGSARAHFNDGVAYLAGWHGLFEHKNTMTAFLVMVAAAVLSFEHRPRVRRWSQVLIVVLVLGAKSSTGLSALLALYCCRFWLVRYTREGAIRRASFVVLSILGFGVAIAGFVAFLPFIVNLYGKDLTFTGRTQIWSAALWAIGKRLTMGYGREGVWFRTGIPPTYEIDQRIGFVAGHAHNAYLELLLEVGLVGLVLYVGLLRSAFRAAWRRMTVTPDIAGWGIMCLAAQFVASLSESPVFGIWFVIPGWIYVFNRRRIAVGADQPVEDERAGVGAGPRR